MNTKILGATAAVAALTLALTACASSGDPVAAETDAASNEKLLAGQSFVIAVSDDEVPYGYTDDQGEFVGVTADLLSALADELGFEYTTEASDFAAAIPGVQSGKYDLSFRQIGITEERVEILDLLSWKYDGVTFETLADGGTTIGDEFEGICGLNVGILQGEAKSEATLTELSEQCRADGDAAITISPFPDRATADLAVKSGRVDIATNGVGQLAFAQAQEEGVWAATGPVFNEVFQGIAFPEGSELIEQFAAGLQALIDNGEYGRILAEHGVADVAIEAPGIDVIA